MHFILIVMRCDYGYGAVAMSEFNTKTACESARTTLLGSLRNKAGDMHEDANRGSAWCASKG
jgi:hypothetical protein